MEDLNRDPADSLTEIAELATMVDLNPVAFGGGVFVVRGQGRVATCEAGNSGSRSQREADYVERDFRSTAVVGEPIHLVTLIE